MALTLTLSADLHNLRLIGSCKRSPESPASLPRDSVTISARFRTFRTRPGARPVVCSRRSLEGHHMRPTKLSTLAAAAAAAAALTLAACSSSGGSTASSAHPTITYWASNQGTSLQDDQQVLTPQIAKFTKQTGIKVKFQVIPWTTLLNQITAATVSGKGPDVLNIGNTWSASLQATGAFLPFSTSVMNT